VFRVAEWYGQSHHEMRSAAYNIPVLGRIFAVLAISFPLLGFAQAAPSSVDGMDPAQRKQAEDIVARRIIAIRESARLPPLKRIAPTSEELQLVCSAALTQRSVNEPMYGALETYSIGDLTSDPERLKVIALGTSKGEQSGSRHRVYSDKDWPRYSVVVYRSARSTAQEPEYVVGVARRQSPMIESLGPITFDHPIRDSHDWAKQVVPACRDQKP
jgi:hypothetical protein